MSKYGYLDVFQRVPWSSRQREPTVFFLIISTTMVLKLTHFSAHTGQEIPLLLCSILLDLLHCILKKKMSLSLYFPY